MTSITEPSKFVTPFAESGLKNTIPATANNATGKAGFDKGFPERTMLPKASGGIPPSGMDFNGILYDITSAIRYMQAGGRPTYDAAFAATIGGYPSGAVLIGDDGVSVFQNAVAGNETDPNSGGAGWTRPDLQVMELYRRSYAEAGYNVVGTFQAGFTYVNANDVGIDLATGEGYTGPAGMVAAGTNPSSGGFISRANAPQLEKSDIAKFGYVYGSGLDGKNAVLAAITATGIAHISGSTTLSRFDWPQGAKVTGNATITYSRLPAVPCVLDSSISVDLSKMKAVFVHQVYDICDMLQLKSAGFNTIIHYGQFGGTSGNMTKACDAADAIGIKMILGGPLYGQTDTPAQDLNGRDCVIGYYLYDEPQNAGVTVAAQQARINAFRAFTSKKLVMTDHNQFSFDSSTVPSGVGAPGYDIIFVDKYYHDAQTEEFIKRDAIAAWGELAHKTVNAEIMPCVGAFSTDLNGGSDAFKNKSKQISFAKQFFKMGDGGYAAFSWESNLIVNTHRTITIDADFYALIKGLNGVMTQNPFETETVVFGKKTLIELMSIRDAVYSSPDVTPFAVVNAGSNINERQNVFADAGLAVRNSGGLLATKLRSSGCVVIEFFFQNYVDATAVTYSLTTSPDDFYTVTESLTKSVSSASSFWTGIVETTKDQAIGIRCTPAASYVNRWKFLRGGMVICSWSGLGF